MDEIKEIPKGPTVYKWVRRKENIPEIYCNFMHASWTGFDVRFKLGQVVPTDADLGTDPISQFINEEVANVTVAWPNVKNLRDMLNKLVESYESVNGEINPPTVPPTIP